MFGRRPAGLIERWPMPVPGPGTLSIVSRPLGGRGLERDLLALAEQGIDQLVSLQTESEALALGLAGEGEACGKLGIGFTRYPITDHGVPDDPADFHAFTRELAERVGHGAGVGVHCFASIGRSGLVAVAVLMHRGLMLRQASSEASRARGLRVPETPAQFQWLERFDRRFFEGG